MMPASALGEPEATAAGEVEGEVVAAAVGDGDGEATGLDLCVTSRMPPRTIRTPMIMTAMVLERFMCPPQLIQLVYDFYGPAKRWG
jgi:hypothetical protein